MMDHDKLIETAITREEHAANVKREVEDWANILKGYPSPVTIHPQGKKRRYGRWD